MPGQTLLQHASGVALLKGLMLLRGNEAHHLAAMLCSVCAQGSGPQDFSVLQAGGQGAEEQKYLTPAAIQLNLQRWVPMPGQKGAKWALAQHLASVLPLGAI